MLVVKTSLSVTKVPAVGDAGGVLPGARRMITPVSPVPIGSFHAKVIEVEADLVALRSVTGSRVPAGAVVCPVTVAAAEYTDAPFWTKSA
jgi:hypothetical protein